MLNYNSLPMPALFFGSQNCLLFKYHELDEYPMAVKS